jgi:cobalt/nickel transport protein
MPAQRAVVMALGWAFVVVSPLPAHFNMLLPSLHMARRGEPVTLLYQWGHPFEHQLFDAPLPESFIVLSPDNQRIDLTSKLQKRLQGPGGKQVIAYQVQFTPESRGDYTFFLKTPPIWMEEDQEFLQDTVKVVLHVQAQKGWDSAVGNTSEMIPLTRPYGLEPGMVFQALALLDEPDRRPHNGRLPAVAGSAGILVEIERYNPDAPGQLPPDEHITRTVRTDAQGLATCTLTDPGWWCITAQHDSGRRLHGGKEFPVRKRATLWVRVDQKPVPGGDSKPAKDN